MLDSFFESLQGERLWAAVIVLGGVLALVWQVLKMGLASVSEMISTVMFIVRAIAREIADKNVQFHERLNGILILLLFLALIATLVLLAIPSIRALLLGDGADQILAGVALLELLAIAFVGVICVKSCMRHNREIEIARNANK